MFTDTYCDPRSEDHATLLSSTLPHSDQYPTVSSQLHYQCDVGFVLSDNTKTKSVTCRDAAGTYYWEDDSGKCKGVCVHHFRVFLNFYFKTEKWNIIFTHLESNIENFFSVVNCSSLSGAGTWYDVSSENVSYGSIITVTCNSSLFMADGKTFKTVTCLDTGQWNGSVTPCTCTSESRLMINLHSHTPFPLLIAR